jgi:hypothetical protein
MTADASIPVQLVAYINGVRMYPSACSVSANVGDTATFSLTFPAVAEFMLLPPRSHAAVFFVDPVAGYWRLLVEGELSNINRSKQGEGERSLALQFDSLHGAWKYFSYGAALETVSSVPAQQISIGLGRVITTDTKTTLSTFSSIVQKSIGTSFDLASVVTGVARNALTQSPLESFYNESRKAFQKIVSVEDDRIKSLLNAQFLSLVTNMGAQLGESLNTQLAEIVSSLLGLGFYTQTTVLAPPTGTSGIQEQAYLPTLFFVVPPVCNVIFKDQVTRFEYSRSYRVEPTRAVTQLQIGGSNNSNLPTYSLVRPGQVANITGNDSAAALTAASNLYGVYTNEEVVRGMVPIIDSFEFHKLVGTLENATSQQHKDFIQSALEYQFSVNRAARRSTNVICAWLPYVQPGFPIVVEDSNGPIYGYLAGVSHSLSVDGSPMTVLQITNVVDLSVWSSNGVLRQTTPSLPSWMNTKFAPRSTEETYRELLGPNLVEGNPQASCVKLGTPEADLGQLLGEVVSVPQLSENAAVTWSSGKIAEAVRARGTRGILEYQYRFGTSLSSYVQFHSLQHSGPVDDFALTPVQQLGADAEPMFGIPSAIADRKITETTNERQKVAKLIRDALDRGTADD